MAVKQQKVVVTISNDGDDEMTINIKFTPCLAGSKSPAFKKQSDTEKNLQYMASKIGGYVMESLKRDAVND